MICIHNVPCTVEFIFSLSNHCFVHKISSNSFESFTYQFVCCHKFMDLSRCFNPVYHDTNAYITSKWALKNWRTNSNQCNSAMAFSELSNRFHEIFVLFILNLCFAIFSSVFDGIQSSFLYCILYKLNHFWVHLYLKGYQTVRKQAIQQLQNKIQHTLTS